ncbi:unnamed protein product [Acidithrix sp. C25]|nr:unnamed protein product [Acidithrix sp. C25]
MTLGYSGYVYVEAQRSQDIANLMEGHSRGFEFIGGASIERLRRVPLGIESPIGV